MHYKRKGHRGRHKKNVMDNQAERLVGNGKRWGHPKHKLAAKAERNKIEEI